MPSLPHPLGQLRLLPSPSPSGVLNFSQWGFYYQLQAMALPANASDPLLREWVKPDVGNPLTMSLPPAGEWLASWMRRGVRGWLAGGS